MPLKSVRVKTDRHWTSRNESGHGQAGTRTRINNFLRVTVWIRCPSFSSFRYSYSYKWSRADRLTVVGSQLSTHPS
eukprot:scaffold365392_cov30-Prasinocladus_malaysianus.AAC.1